MLSQINFDLKIVSHLLEIHSLPETYNIYTFKQSWDKANIHLQAGISLLSQLLIEFRIHNIVDFRGRMG